MKQELLDSIIRDYKDFSKMVETNFEEENDKDITPGRLKRIEKIRNKHVYWIDSDELSIYDNILNEAIDNNIEGVEIGETNKILLYISELNYDTYMSLFKEDYELPKTSTNSTYILYMDIEDNSKYFIQKEYQKEFEETHNVIVKYKNPNCNAGWNFDRNYYEEIKEVRREFIKSTMESSQEEAAKVLLKKYQEKEKGV